MFIKRLSSTFHHLTGPSSYSVFITEPRTLERQTARPIAATPSTSRAAQSHHPMLETWRSSEFSRSHSQSTTKVSTSTFPHKVDGRVGPYRLPCMGGGLLYGGDASNQHMHVIRQNRGLGWHTQDAHSTCVQMIPSCANANAESYPSSMREGVMTTRSIGLRSV